MKQKLNKGVIPFSYKKNVSNYDPNDQSELYKLVTSATKGNKHIAGAVDINHKSANPEIVKALVQRMFATKYPAKRIDAYNKRIAYICKETQNSATHEQQAKLIFDINEILKVEKKNDINKHGAEDISVDEYFPLNVGMKGSKTKKLNEYLKSKGLMSTDAGELFTAETKNALLKLDNGYTTPFSQTDYDKLFVVANNVNNTNSLLSGNNLYIIIAVVIAVAIFFLMKRKKQ